MAKDLRRYAAEDILVHVRLLGVGFKLRHLILPAEKSFGIMIMFNALHLHLHAFVFASAPDAGVHPPSLSVSGSYSHSLLASLSCT
jgi:hypothetical protein